MQSALAALTPQHRLYMCIHAGSTGRLSDHQLSDTHGSGSPSLPPIVPQQPCGQAHQQPRYHPGSNCTNQLTLCPASCATVVRSAAAPRPLALPPPASLRSQPAPLWSAPWRWSGPALAPPAPLPARAARCPPAPAVAVAGHPSSPPRCCHQQARPRRHRRHHHQQCPIEGQEPGPRAQVRQAQRRSPSSACARCRRRPNLPAAAPGAYWSPRQSRCRCRHRQH